MKFIINTHDLEVSKSMIETLLENGLDNPISVKEVKEISEEELDELANQYEEEYTREDYEAIKGTLDYEWGAEINGKTEGFIDGFKAGVKYGLSKLLDKQHQC